MAGKIFTLCLFILIWNDALGKMLAKCPGGWEHHQATDQCYFVHAFGKDRTFFDSRQYCQSHGGELTSVFDVATREFLVTAMAETGHVKENSYMWVGAKEFDDSEWEWVISQVPVDPEILPWAGWGSGSCGALTTNSTLLKKDCKSPLKFICNRPINIPPTCDYDAGWEDLNSNCCKKSKKKNSFHDALLDCQMGGGSLMWVSDLIEQQYVTDFAIYAKDQVWIGLTEENHPGHFKWVDNADSNFTDWGKDQPDLSFKGYGAAVIDHEEADGKWVVEKMFDEYHYMCKKEQGACVYGWETFGESCYFFNTEESDVVVWQDAWDKCKSVGANLVILDSKQEDTFFRNRMPESDTMWLGLYSVPHEKIIWVDNTTMESNNFTHMSAEDKEKAINADSQMCVFLQSEQTDSNGKKSVWIPIDCEEPRQYACEVPAGDPVHMIIPPAGEKYCPDGWNLNIDNCYYFGEEEMTWTKAQQSCQRYSGHLVSINTWAEQDYVHDNQKGDGAWTGFNDRSKEGKWSWSDGTATTITNWNEGEPNGSPDSDENCGQMLLDTGKWNDVSCGLSYVFTCEMKASDTPFGPPASTTTEEPFYNDCGWDWTENFVTGECYRLELEELSFEDAHLHCQELGKGAFDIAIELVSINNAQEQSVISDMVKAQELSQSSLWTAMKNDMDGSHWLDGSPVSYFNYDDGEPNSGGIENCIEMYTQSGKWNDAMCDKRNPFICEKKGPYYVPPQPPPAPDVHCPEGWTFFDNHCYYFSPDAVTWDAANTWCQANLGSQLASIMNEDENTFIYDHAFLTYTNLWIGMHDDNKGKHWHWLDGSDFGEYTDWIPGEPNDQDGVEHCGEFNIWFSDGHWNDMPCDITNNFVCKITVKTCPQDFTYNDKKCYFASETSQPWDVARNKCKEFNIEADLISIHNEEENSFFGNMLTTQVDETWIGFLYNPDTQIWNWTDGLANNYTNWRQGEPNYLDNDFCTTSISCGDCPNQAEWNNLPCSASQPYGCEFFPTHSTGCDEGWSLYNGYCYWYSNSDMMYQGYPFEDARADCQSKGADMVSIHSQEENDFVFSLTNSDMNVWIGLSNQDLSGDMAWSDGSPFCYSNWATLYSYSFSYYGACGLINQYLNDGKWDFSDCYSYYYYLCKKVMVPQPIDPVTSGCHEGDAVYKGSCYYTSDQAVASWVDARDGCVSNGAHLIAVTDRLENAYISSLLGDFGDRTWIGLNGSAAEGGTITFSWVTGEPVDFTNWDEFEPNPERGVCVSAAGDHDSPGLWKVQKCDDSYKYICEYDRDDYHPITPTPTPPPSYYCADGWLHNKNRCYKVFEKSLSWSMAEGYCKSYGAHLTSINNAKEETLIKTLPGISQINDTFLSVWVGLELGDDTGYHWSDDSGVDYLNWADGQPDSQYGREACGSADKKSFKLSDSNCEGYLPYICEAVAGTMVTTVAPPTEGPVQPCPDDPSWSLYEDHCYKFISESEADPQTWWMSHMKCRDEGSELASIHTVEENYWIESMMADMSDEILWIGGSATLDSGFEWLDGTAFDFDNWAVGEPNNYLGQEDCLGLYAHRLGNWNDQNCARLGGRICKRHNGATEPPVVSTRVPAGHCPEGWAHLGTKCLKAFGNLTSNELARSACKALHSGAELVSIHSKKKEAKVMAALGIFNVNAWIGLRSINGEFLWLDQTSVTYTNWAPGEPNGAAIHEECVEAYADNGLWNDVSCDQQKGYICQMTQDPSISKDSPLPVCDEPFDSYLTYRDACYRADDATHTWQEAEDICVKEGSHLASAVDLMENSLLWSIIQQRGYSSVWIGLNNLQDEHVFSWSDGWPTFYTSWGRHEPNTSLTDHNCVKLDVDSGNWFSVTCDQQLPFVCKFKDEVPPTPDPPVTGYCADSRWLDLGGGYCYLIVNNAKQWTEANMNCLKENANVISIHSETEMQLINMTIKNLKNPLWIGLVQKKDGFGWSDGTGFDYINWEDGEPNSDDEKCAEVYPKKGTWNDVACELTRPSICKAPKEVWPDPTDPHPGDKTTEAPGGGGKLSGGAIFGIVIGTLILVAGVGFIGFSHISKKQKPVNFLSSRSTNQESDVLPSSFYSSGVKSEDVDISVPYSTSDA